MDSTPLALWNNNREVLPGCDSREVRSTSNDLWEDRDTHTLNKCECKFPERQNAEWCQEGYEDTQCVFRHFGIVRVLFRWKGRVSGSQCNLCGLSSSTRGRPCPAMAGSFWGSICADCCHWSTWPWAAHTALCPRDPVCQGPSKARGMQGQCYAGWVTHGAGAVHPDQTDLPALCSCGEVRGQVTSDKLLILFSCSQNTKFLMIKKDPLFVCFSACSGGVFLMIRIELITLHYVLSSLWIYHKLLATCFHWAPAASVIRTISHVQSPYAGVLSVSYGNPAAFSTFRGISLGIL